MSSPADLDRIRARAAEIGLDPSAIEGFSQMDRDTLIIQAALWHRIAIAHQNQRFDSELRSGEMIRDLFTLCRDQGIDIPEALCEAANALTEPTSPKV
jgi:hypothetical protein